MPWNYKVKNRIPHKGVRRFSKENDKGVCLLKEERRLNFFPKADVWEDLVGIFLRPLIIYCIRYIEYAKVGNGPALRILGESII